ncbi:alginate O-acetyltransferase [Alcanivorax sp. DP30]|uniref:alginate O-acetyltransferase AlgX-related protein n=1 Tax=Alcanivorax sp. DP30 TaxID=2606217 RepID=UPI0013718C11|nr:alginate O-acetyltransferase [Alcanivorax sp. DP30]MZR61273.1 alginate O-acetyltransferase [Alcanivorax sp. DP30]
MIPMKQASLLNGWLFLAVIFAGFLSLLYPVGHFFVTEPAAWQQFRQGELVRKLERRVDEEFVLRKPSIAFWADTSFLLFKAGRPGVLVGEKDWLFSREEYYYDSRSERFLADNLAQLAATVCVLEGLGKQVLLVPVPAKRRLYAQWSARPVSTGMDALYQRITGALSDSHIAWVDTLGLMQRAASQGAVFMRTDTHWSPLGAQVVAAGVALNLSLPGSHHYETRELRVEPYEGDLLRYLPTSEGVGPVRKEPLMRYETAAVDQMLDAQALLGDDLPPVALVGTSYSAMDEWHFSGFLKQQLSEDVLVYALEAQGPFAAMREFLDGPAARDERVRYVLWEVPERALIQSMEPIVREEHHACMDRDTGHAAELAGVGSPGR